ncbi:MAG TPA: PQQ-dependent sugar dehydrogenase [Anaerolineales bacterium]|nr:PQQ-dependent sugar dehydrogenase [Anaerolineales bacterium]
MTRLFKFALVFLPPVLLACSLLGATLPTPTPRAGNTPVPLTTAAPPASLTSTPTPEPTLTFTLSPPARVDELPDPATFEWSQYADGLSSPIDIQNAGDDRLFVVEQAGLIRILRDGELLPEPFLDIRDRVDANASERGLLGLAFHPEYQDTGLFFVNYTGDGGTTFIARFAVGADPDRADPSSEMDLLEVSQPYRNHNGGGLAFGPDGYLYVGLGDGGSAGDPQGNGQRLDTLLGKLLRLDVDSAEPYAIPPDNPFAGGGGRPETWAYGLRNPWRFSFDLATGQLFVADVGQGDWEEVDWQPAGATAPANYGWNLREGSHEYQAGDAPELVDPVTEYNHTQGCAVTGGVVVRDPSLPEWQGVYLYGDFCSGRMWGLLQGGGGWHNNQLFDTPFSISSFGVDHEGSVFVADYAGAVYQLQRKP